HRPPLQSPARVIRSRPHSPPLQCALVWRTILLTVLTTALVTCGGGPGSDDGPNPPLIAGGPPLLRITTQNGKPITSKKDYAAGTFELFDEALQRQAGGT